MFKEIILICLPLIVASYSASAIIGDLAATPFDQHNTNASTFVVGGSYDSMSLHPGLAKFCLKAAADQSNIQLSNPSSIVELQLDENINSIQRALGVEYSASFGFGPFSGSSSYHYAQSSQNDYYTINLRYLYRYNQAATFKPGVLNYNLKDLLTPEAFALRNSPKEFRKLCGDSFIEQMDAGLSLLMRLTLKFDSRSEKEYFEHSLNKISGLNNILNIIKINPNNVHFNLSAAGIQVGGNPELLTQLFEKNGGKMSNDGYPVLECGSQSSSKAICGNLVGQIIDYAQSIGEQLNSHKDHYLLNPVETSWERIGIKLKQAKENQQVVTAMKQLTELQAQDYQDLNYLTNYRRMLASKDKLSRMMRHDLDDLIANYQLVLSAYSDPKYKLMECFNGYTTEECLPIHAAFSAKRQQILANQKLQDLLLFLKTNQYAASLMSSLPIRMICYISPISDRKTNQYMVNCNGQTSGSFDPAKAIMLKRSADYSSLTVKNLIYNYAVDGANLEYSYQFKQPLPADGYYPGAYYGTATIYNGYSTFIQNADLYIVNLF